MKSALAFLVIVFSCLVLPDAYAREAGSTALILEDEAANQAVSPEEFESRNQSAQDRTEILNSIYSLSDSSTSSKASLRDAVLQMEDFNNAFGGSIGYPMSHVKKEEDVVDMRGPISQYLNMHYSINVTTGKITYYHTAFGVTEAIVYTKKSNLKKYKQAINHMKSIMLYTKEGLAKNNALTDAQNYQFDAIDKYLSALLK